MKENAGKPHVGPNLGLSGPNLGHSFFYLFFYSFYLFIYFDVSALLDVRHCPKLESCAISTKTNDANSKKMAKNLILDLIYASWALCFNLTSSVNRNHGQLSSCQISVKANDPFLRKLNDRRTKERTDRPTDESDFIQCCSTNVMP